ncbi:SIS domain-containing protein [Anaerocolumna jejuensis]|uniref:SIS domain-containing protein n=1 Tax=Anaerocolumna jejuensis TaxID=259063 RepID=UPI003F7BE836
MRYYGDAIKYIYETPGILKNIWMNRHEILKSSMELLKKKEITEIYITGSGSSYHSAAAVRLFWQKLLGIRVYAVNPVLFMEDIDYIDKNAVIIGISQQGTSAAGIRALDEAAVKGFATLSVTGEYNSEITRHASANLYVECGYEDAGATTKGYTATVFTLMVMGLELALDKGRLQKEDYLDYEEIILKLIANMPEVIRGAEVWYENIKEELAGCSNLVILSYGNQIATMLEGVLKFSETCRFPVRGYEMEEFMHGMYNAVDEHTGILYIAEEGKYKNRMLRLYRYYMQQGQVQFGLNLEEKIPANITGCFLNEEVFSALEYILAIQILFVRSSRARGIDLNIPRDPDFHKIMKSKLEK